MPHERSPAMPASVGAGPGDATEASAAQGTEPAVSHDRPLRFRGVSASILVRRLQGGECLAAVGIDLATVGPAPGHEAVDIDIDAHGRLVLPGQLGLHLGHALDELGVGVVKGVAVGHHGLRLVPLGL